MQLVQHRGVGKGLLMGLLGAVAGYVTLALTSTLVQEVWLGGVSYRESERLVLILAGHLYTTVCVRRWARWCAPRRALTLARGSDLCRLIMVETHTCTPRRVSMDCSTKASAISERWQRHGTASAHINTRRCDFACWPVGLKE